MSKIEIEIKEKSIISKQNSKIKNNELSLNENQSNKGNNYVKPKLEQSDSKNIDGTKNFDSKKTVLKKTKPEKLDIQQVIQPPVDAKRDSNLQIVWENITMTAEITEGRLCNKTTKTKTILEDISGSICSGETLAILGASGAGKTTFLNFLSAKIESSTLSVTGRVTLNNEELDKPSFAALTSYVMQDDLLEAHMTPKEILLYTAKLKLKGTIDEIQDRVRYLLKLLRIEKCQNTQIGNNLERGVSGGERKRTSIAFELLSDTPIIFLDEPTTGLDSYNAYEVVKITRELAKINNKIVIFTIHQPASEIFELLDKICIFALGKTVYFGEVNGLNSYFKEAKLPIPELYNPFEHIIEVTNWSAPYDSKIIEAYPQLNDYEDKIEKYRYLVGEYNKVYNEKFKHKIQHKFIGIEDNIKLEIARNLLQSHGVLYQFYILTLKLIIKCVRNKGLLAANIIQYLGFAVINSIVFNNLKKDNVGVRDKIGIYALCSMMIVFNTVNSLILVCKLFFNF